MSTSTTPDQQQTISPTTPPKLHKLFTLPATEKRGELNVSYSIAGPDIGEGGDDVPNIMFCGGMFGTRWMAAWYDYLAEKKGVRMIFIDRPGFGTSTPVPVPLRLPTFLETIPALLTHLRIPHIHLASHSAGTIYALNLLYHQPSLLYPSNPTVTFFSPWVHQSISSDLALSAAAMLPNSLLNHWDGLTQFAIQRAGPVFASSSGALGAFTGMFSNFGSGSKEEQEREKEVEDEKYRAGYGMSTKEKEEFDKRVFGLTFAENTTGANDEARLCLKSVEGSGWGACEDYEVLVGQLKEMWEIRVSEGGKKLRVKYVFGEEKDSMIGVKGRKYWEAVWTHEKCGSGMEVVSREVKGGNHDTVIDCTKGAIGEMFDDVKPPRNP